MSLSPSQCNLLIYYPFSSSQHVGQIGRTFNTRYKEHIHDIRTNNSNTGYANHILNTGHTYGTIIDTMEIMKTERKGRYLNTLERYYY
jgi:hypothetical protein